MSDEFADDEPQYIIPGSIDAVVFGTVLIGAGYAVRSHLGVEYGTYVAILGVIIAAAGVGKVVYDIVCGFPGQKRLFR